MITRQRERWIEVWEDDVKLWRILCNVDEWRVWKIEGHEECHDNVNRDNKSGPDTTAQVLAALEEARHHLRGLPSDRKQNYEVHRALDKVEKMVREISTGVCYAWEAKRKG